MKGSFRMGQMVAYNAYNFYNDYRVYNGYNGRQKTELTKEVIEYGKRGWKNRPFLRQD